MFKPDPRNNLTILPNKMGIFTKLSDRKVPSKKKTNVKSSFAMSKNNLEWTKTSSLVE